MRCGESGTRDSGGDAGFRRRAASKRGIYAAGVMEQAGEGTGRKTARAQPGEGTGGKTAREQPGEGAGGEAAREQPGEGAGWVDAGLLGAEPGLCGECAHAKVNRTRRGTAYLRCLRAAWDPAMEKYPRLPVLTCTGFDPGETSRRP